MEKERKEWMEEVSIRENEREKVCIEGMKIGIRKRENVGERS